MILLDSLYINNSGGKILLDYLVSECESRDLDVFYLFDDRCINDYQNIPEKRKCYLKANLFNRYKFYIRKGNTFSNILSFGNLPPSVRVKGTVYTYFHQPLYLDIPDNITTYNRILLKIKICIVKYLKRNSDFWIVQRELVKDGLKDKYKIDEKNILILPFYPSIVKDGNKYSRKVNTFLYVSGGAPHKNHVRLIDAFCLFYDENRKGTLTLTIPSVHKPLSTLIEYKQERGYPIFNLGFIDRKELYKVYNEHEYLMFPSLAESFGLGLVEAIDNGCKVIGSDLPYLYEVCEPSFVFNPTDTFSIKNAFEKAIIKELKPSKSKVINRIETILNLLTESNGK